MRPILALSVAVMILGGVHLFLASTHSAPSTMIDRRPAIAEGEFAIEVLLTFDAAPDPFASEGSEASLTVRYKGDTIYSEDQALPAGKSIRLDGVKGISVGPNEFFVTAFASDTDPDRIHAVRVRVLRGGTPIASRWLASDPGKPVDGPVLVEVPQTSDTGPP